MYKIKSDCRGMNSDEIFNQILLDRNIDEDFLNPTESDLLALNSLKNVGKAYNIIEKGIKENKKILIHYDVDTDGITAGTIILKYLKKCGVTNIDWTINEAKAHGLKNQDIKRFSNCDILVIVDSLDDDCTIYEQIYNMGIEIIVLDHHLIQNNDYDNYITLISSQRDYDNPDLSGAGVVWKFCKYIDEENLTNYADDLIDLACTGIIADMMNMRSAENRYICKCGFENLHNPFIKKIVGTYPFNSTAVSFSIASLINSANRMNCNELAVLSMIEDDNKELNKLIKQLKQCKQDQNDIVHNIMPEVFKQADEQINNKVISVIINSHSSVSGLIGNKILAKYQRPIMVLKPKKIKNIEYYAGSIRAIGVDNFQKMCVKAGATSQGHENAAGLQIEKSRYDEFIASLKNQLIGVNFEEDVFIDIQINLEDVTQELINKIKEIDKITGENFKPIKVLIQNVNDYNISNMSGGKHLIINTNNLTFIKWNWIGNFEDMEDNSIISTPLKLIGSLNSGFIGRTFMKQMILDNIEVGE